MDADEIRLKLRQRAAQLVERVEKIQSDLGSEKPQDWAERAIAVENDEVLERLGETEREEIAAIRAALARLDAGTYGTCSKCGEAIAPGRLEALPYTIVCVDCAS
jgi:RNA polymerase-binding protein DksA